MTFTNSPLVSYKRISPHKTTNRNHAIDTITIHCIVGQWTAKQGCDYFATTDRQCSSNYIVGKDGSIGLAVEEKDRSWCSSSSANDHRAITIEVASDTSHPFTVTNTAYNALIKLVADICKRNGIKKLLWQGNKSLIGKVEKQNMTAHRWFANTACPGDYLFNRYGDIASKVNAIIGGTTATPTSEPVKNNITYRVQTGVFSQKLNADELLSKIKKVGFDGLIVQSGGMYKVQVGSYNKKENADEILKKLKSSGFNGFITTEGGTKISSIKKSVTEIAKEVIQGNWGNGQDRKNRIIAAGYDYNEVQKEVNKLI